MFTNRTPGLERYATETNKLIIRLQKLLADRPTDSVQRKQQEQTVSTTKAWIIKKKKKLGMLCGSFLKMKIIGSDYYYVFQIEVYVLRLKGHIVHPN